MILMRVRSELSARVGVAPLVVVVGVVVARLISRFVAGCHSNNSHGNNNSAGNPLHFNALD